jgi:uncharacterized protein YjcR
MLSGETNLSQNAKNAINEIKKEAITIRNVVKKMLEISDVVETSYTNHEKMLDINKSSKSLPEEPPKTQVQSQKEVTGFEDYMEENSGKKSQKTNASKRIPTDQAPGFEDYLEDKARASSASNPASTKSDTPGFEDYLDE